MKIYVIGKFEQKELVREVYGKLREIGCEISCDWTTHQSIKPYSENPKLATEYSEEEMKAIAESDIIIYLSSKEGTTSKLEVGGAMLLNFTRGKPKMIYLVGEFNTSSPWFMNPRVKRVNSVEEVIKELKNLKP
ncbi:MAG: hypothetical protein ABIH49_02650 [archaeon]